MGSSKNKTIKIGGKFAWRKNFKRDIVVRQFSRIIFQINHKLVFFAILYELSICSNFQ